MNRVSAFTLVELLVTLTILAILSTVWFLSYFRENADARDTARVGNIKLISKDIAIKLSAWTLEIDKLVSTSLPWNTFTGWYVTNGISISDTTYSVGIPNKNYFSGQDFFDPGKWKEAFPLWFFSGVKWIYYQIAATLENEKATIQWNYFKYGSGDLLGIIKAINSENPVTQWWTDIPY